MNAVTPTAVFPRLLNAVATLADSAINTTHLNVDDLVAIATRKTNYVDFGDHQFKDRLTEISAALVAEGNLNAFGRFALGNYLAANMVKRLNIVEFLKRHPEINDRKINQPVFITGWYRTGTTFLHNLIFNNAKQSRAPLLWELMNPCPTKNSGKVNVSSRILKTRLTMMFQRWISPNFQSAHPLSADSPDECLHLMENAGLSSMAFFLSEAKSYAWQLLESDQSAAYAFYRKQLQLLDWQRPGKRWVLKWPLHLWHLDALFQVFPDAKVIWLQRDPVEAIPSACHLAELGRRSFCKSIDRDSLGKFYLNYCKAGQQRAAAISHENDSVLAVDYRNLVENPSTTLESIAAFADLELEIYKGVTNRQRTGNKSYSAQDFGLTDDEIHKHFK